MRTLFSLCLVLGMSSVALAQPGGGGGDDPPPPPANQFTSLQKIRELEACLEALDVSLAAIDRKYNESVDEYNRVGALVATIPHTSTWRAFCDGKMDEANDALDDALAHRDDVMIHKSLAEGYLSNAKFRHNQGLYASAIEQAERGVEQCVEAAKDITNMDDDIEIANGYIADALAGYELWLQGCCQTAGIIEWIGGWVDWFDGPTGTTEKKYGTKADVVG